MMLLDTLLTTRFRIPAVRPDLVTRPQLLSHLDEGLRRGVGLTLVSAPAGFGKTTLISQWAASLNRPVAWVTCDSSVSLGGGLDTAPRPLGNDPLVFMQYLISAIRVVRPDSKAPAAEPLAAHESPRALAVSLLNALAEANLPLVLVLDDYHAITHAAVHELTAFILDNRPPELHVVIITREDPPLPLARMRARGQVNEVRERALRFSHQESVAFFSQTMALSLSAQAVTTLENRTEGWITALQLAGVAMSQQDDIGVFIASFAGNDRYIVDYILNEVLTRASESLRQFLCQTSVLDRFCAPLCQAITGSQNAQAMLESIERANLFLIPLDNRREWYRYHSLFAEVMRLTLTEDEQCRLHRLAAAWCAEQHSVSPWDGLAEIETYHRRLIAELCAADEGTAHMAQSLVEPLSEREIEIMRLVTLGDSNADIARKLFITIGTTKRHINHIFGKLGVHSRSKAISRARELGLVE